MRKVNQTTAEARMLQAMGTKISEIIQAKGWKSPYDFWVETAGDVIPRSTLNSILKGELNVTLRTLIRLAKCLGVEPKELLDVKVSSK